MKHVHLNNTIQKQEMKVHYGWQLSASGWVEPEEPRIDAELPCWTKLGRQDGRKRSKEKEDKKEKQKVAHTL